DWLSGDHAGMSISPATRVSCLTCRVLFDQTKICSWSGLSAFAAHVDSKASHLPLGDQTGFSLEQSLASASVLRVVSFSESARSVRWICIPSGVSTDHATVFPSGEMAASCSN